MRPVSVERRVGPLRMKQTMCSETSEEGASIEGFRMYAETENESSGSSFLLLLTLLPVLWPLTKWLLLAKNFDYWKERGVHYLEPEIFFGNMKEAALLRQSVHEVQLKIYRRVKGHPVVGIFEGNIPSLMVLDPELIKKVLAFDYHHFEDRKTSSFRFSRYTESMLLSMRSGEWRRLKAAMLPMFSNTRIKRDAFPQLQEASKRLSDHLRRLVQDNGGDTTGDVEVRELMGSLILGATAELTTGAGWDHHREMGEAASGWNKIKTWRKALALAIVTGWLPASLSRLIPVSIANETALQALARFATDRLRDRLSAGTRRDDLLQVLSDNIGGEFRTEKGNTKCGAEAELSIGAQIAMVLLAAYENAGTTLALALCSIAHHPQVQQRLQEELLEVTTSSDPALEYDRIKSMTYLDAVISETLRMYPPFSRLERVCTAEYSFPGGLKIEKGTRVQVPVYGLHHDPDYFPDPHKFDPSRFCGERTSGVPLYVYLPFGAGPKNCLGITLGLLACKVIMSRLLSEYRVVPAARTGWPVKTSKMTTFLKPQDGIWLSFEPLDRGESANL